MGEQTAKAPGLNRAKTYQLVLFPLNNGATNVYYVLVLSYIATFGSKVLALSMIFASVMVTGMRLFDAITDPIIGALMDRTNGKFGKFRPFMVIGNLIMAASILVLYCLTPLIPAGSMFLRYAAFAALYAVWVIGYTFQTSCTRSGQTVLTNDPKQRPLFTIFNTVGSLLGMGVMQFFAPILAKNYEGGYASAGFFRTLAPVGIVISILLTVLAIIGIWEKDRPKYFGIGGEVSEKVKLHEYVQIIKNNNPMQRLMVAGAGCKLALSIATNTTVLCMLYGCMMGSYDGLYLPMMVLGYVFSVPFFLLTVRTSQKEGQKASLMKYVSVAFICYIGVLVLLLLWGRSDAFTLSIMGDNGLSINLYTILFIAFFGIGYGAYYATSHGRRLLRLRDLPQRQLHSRHHGYAVQPGGQAGVQPVRYRRRHRCELHRPREPAHPVRPLHPRYELGGHRAVLHHPDGGLGRYPYRHEGLHPDRREDEGDPGGQRLPPRRCGQRHEAGRGHDQVAEHGPAARRVPQLSL